MQKSIPQSYIPHPQNRPCRIAIFSDSHANDSRFSAAIAIAEETGPIDAALHLGDHASDITLLQSMQPNWPVFTVRGNNDYFSKKTSDELLLFCGDFGIFACHGHQYPASQRPVKMAERAAKAGAHLACFGHTHVVFFNTIHDILVLNPGSVAYPRDPEGSSFAIANIQGMHCDIEIIRTNTFTLG